MISVVDKEKTKGGAEKIRLVCQHTLEHITCLNSEQKQKKNIPNWKHFKKIIYIQERRGIVQVFQGIQLRSIKWLHGNAKRE